MSRLTIIAAALACCFSIAAPGVLHAGQTERTESPLDAGKTPGVSDSGADTKSETSAKSVTDPNALDDKATEDDGYPKMAMSADMMFNILKAEFLDNANDLGKSFDSFMEVAEQTKDPRLAKRAAQVAVKDKNYADALKACRLWHELAPDNEDAGRFYAGFLIHEEEFDELKTHYGKELAACEPDKLDAMFFNMQKMLSSAADRKKGNEVLKEILVPYSGHANAHTALAISAFMAGIPEKAREEADVALAIKGDTETAVLIKAQLAKDPAEARAIMEAFLEQNPDAREVRLTLARFLIASKSFEAARQQFDVLLRKNPNDIPALQSMGLLYLYAKRLTTAEHYLARYVKAVEAASEETPAEEMTEEDYNQVVITLAQIAAERKQYAKALGWLDKIDTEEDEELEVSVEAMRALLEAKRGNVKGMRAMIAKMKENNPQAKEKLILTEAHILKEMGKMNESLKTLKDGTKELPKSADLMYEYAIMSEDLNRFADMEAALKRVIEIDPGYYHAFNALGYSFANRNIRLDEAYTLIDRADKLAPDNPFITDSLGWVLFRQGKLEEAEKQLRKAYTIRPETEIAVHLGEVLWVAGKKEEAMLFFDAAGQSDPDNKVYRETVRRLKITAGK